MGSALDSKQHQQNQYQFPLSPPSSGPVTAASSPLLPTLTAEDHGEVDKLLHSSSSTRFPHISSPPSRRRQTVDRAPDSDGDMTEQTSPRQNGRRPLHRRPTPRALTLPSSNSTASTSQLLLQSPPKTARPLFRRSSSSSSSSCSSSLSLNNGTGPPHPSSSGMGRKVAASLQLFKETVPPSEDSSPVEAASKAETSAAGRRVVAIPNGSSFTDEDVAEAKFEFVKRTEWPDREAAADRREKSMTALQRVRTRESLGGEIDEQRLKDRTSSMRDMKVSDLAQWRKDIVSVHDSSSRGRRRERTADDMVPDENVRPDLPSTSRDTANEPSSPFNRPRSRAYPPSPSPSRSPSARLSTQRSHLLPDHHIMPSDHDRHAPPIYSPSCLSPLPSFHSRPPSPAQTASPINIPSAQLSPLETTTFSPWSTEDESTWDDTASATTTTSTASGYSAVPFSQHDGFGPAYADSGYEETHPNQLAAIPPHAGKGLLSADMEGMDADERMMYLGVNLSQEHLPHIPLRPFRNQVGGHSAIYKFTKRAVCKPLVSRENLFYEAVEREAPPLLAFIPRYLGVMLVSYRRVPKAPTGPSSSAPASTNSIHDTPRASRPAFPKALSDVCPRTKKLSFPGLAQRSVMEENDQADTDSDQAEMPEVVLARNRHIIPEWMLRGGRNRSLSQSNATGSSVWANRQLKRQTLHRGTASSPDLGTPETISIARAKPSPLARYPPFVSSEMEAPTPANSPSQSSRPFPPTLGECPVPRKFLMKGTEEEEEEFSRPGFPAFNSDSPINNISQSPVFGGTGSTMVNTKLKDHVFSTVLRRFRRRTGGRWAGTRTEDEGDVADAEDDDGVLGRSRTRRRSKKLMSQVDRLKKDEIPMREAPIRRVQSESMIASPAKLQSLALEQQRSKEMMGVFDMDDDTNGNGLKTWYGDNLDPLNPSLSRRRSRSRSLDSHPLPSFPVSHSSSYPEHAPIPEQNESDPSFTRQNHFILMEDLTGRLKHPCVMDLKMGTRQYGMDAVSAKKKSQRKKCDRTTSRSLGVRLCGMQVWNHVTQSYVTQDKYMGREVRPDDFPSVLASFLYDGERLLAHQIPVLLQKLYALARIISRLKGFRFYGCSLLLIYDGDRDSQDSFRLSTLEHPSSRSKRGESLERQKSYSNLESTFEKPLRRSHSEDVLVGPISKRFSGRRKRGEVNMRLVDFAHTTTGRDWLPHPGPNDQDLPHEVVASSQGYQGEVDPETGLIYARFPPHYPDEPDRGFLWGLKNLAVILERIWNEERIRRMKASRDDPSMAEFQLPPLSTDGRQVFDEIFDPGDEEDPGMIST